MSPMFKQKVGMTKIYAKGIAELFLIRCNPYHWDGSGEVPDNISFDVYKRKIDETYAGDDETETDQPLAVIADGVRNDDDDSKRMLWVDESLTHVEPLTDNYLKRQGAATEKQLDEYDA